MTRTIPAEPRPGQRRPRLGIMGEFSSGKSTLTNLLVGGSALPVRVTATQLPSVWLSHGDRPPLAHDLEGGTHPVDLGALDDLDPRKFTHIRAFRQAPFLESCDLIDFPGISDPNIPPEIWRRPLPLIDAVIWCTHGNQAWRQSEAAVWEDMPGHLWDRSLLLVTRMDRIGTGRDRRRLLSRLEREAGALFRRILPVSLTDALAAGEDPAALAASGADALMTELADLLEDLPLTGCDALPLPERADGADDGHSRCAGRSAAPSRVSPPRRAVRRIRVAPGLALSGSPDDLLGFLRHPSCIQ